MRKLQLPKSICPHCGEEVKFNHGYPGVTFLCKKCGLQGQYKLSVSVVKWPDSSEKTIIFYDYEDE